MTDKLFDTHAHYFDARFAAETVGAEALLPALFAGDVCGIVNVGTDLATSKAVVAQAARYPAMFAAAGIHPTDGMRYSDFDAAVADLAALIGTPEDRRKNKIVALGEIGLDYHYDDTDRARQAALFEAQLTLAETLDMPVIIHDREAHGDCFEAVLRHPHVRGVFHSYSGSAELARELTRRGWYVSFSGTVTFKNADRVREAVRVVPEERLLIETDCPYLSPVPHRGEINHSGYLCYTAAAVAAARGVAPEHIAAVTADNARRLFGI